ncbi:MAG: 4Fe-4S dicluster domain-containing protein, partial [Candidatus Tectomicrobia bacterium]|nr:4Fe-4S dicluster domain-containing protein [Candidatus Tectomicrobia bacterium]
GRAIFWMEVRTFLEGEYPHVKARYMPTPCMHCENPPCTKVCPTGATYKNDQGTVGQIYPRCIGCRYCMNACPYTVKFFNWYPPQWPETMQNFNPDVSVRPKGVVEKCTFCHHRLQHAKEQADAEERQVAVEGEYVPACVQACPAQALYFGDLDDRQTQVSQLSRSSRAFRLLEDLGTEPKVFYLSEGEWHAGRQD